MSDALYLIIGTSFMALMMFTIILFLYFFQRKLAAKTLAYAAIEKLMQKEELKSAYALIEGQEQERKRIAGELHDNIGSLLATLKIYSDLSLQKSDPADILHLNQKINQVGERLSIEVRKLSYELDLRTLSGFGLKVALQQLAEAINDSGKLSVATVIEILQPVNELISLNIYRIIQELLTNTLKHAAATQVRIEITLIDHELTLIYEDNGKGFEVQHVRAAGMGLQNINSRANLMNAKMTVDSSTRGTTYILEVINYERN